MIRYDRPGILLSSPVGYLCVYIYIYIYIYISQINKPIYIYIHTYIHMKLGIGMSEFPERPSTRRRLQFWKLRARLWAPRL